MAAAPVRYADGLLAAASSAFGAIVVGGGMLGLCLMVPSLDHIFGLGPPIATGLSVVLVASAARVTLLGGRAGTAVALTFAAFVPAFWLLSWLSLGPHSDGELVMLLGCTAVPFGLTIAVLTAPVVLRLERALGAAARLAVLPAMLVTTVLVGLAAVRCASRPDLPDYVASLPVTRVVQYGPVALPSATVTYERKTGTGGANTTCQITSGTTVLFDPTQTDDMNPDESQPCGGLELRHDERLGLWTFTDRTAERAPRLTLDDHGRFRTRDSRTLARSIAPPRGWVSSALMGLAIAAASLVVAALHRGAARRVSGEDGLAREQLEARARGCSLAALVVVMLGGASLVIAALCGLVV